MELHILKITIEYRGSHKKGITIFNATEVSLQQQQQIVSITKMYFLKLQKDESNEKIDFFGFLKMTSVYLFRAALYEVKVVLHKDVLFHWRDKTCTRLEKN